MTAPTQAQMAPAEALNHAQIEGTEICRIADLMDQGGFSEAQWEEWEARHERFLDWALALPTTGDYAPAKTLAFFSIHHDPDESQDFATGTTDKRLALQVLTAIRDSQPSAL